MAHDLIVTAAIRAALVSPALESAAVADVEVAPQLGRGFPEARR
jgi:hypothetical protein